MAMVSAPSKAAAVPQARGLGLQGELSHRIRSAGIGLQKVRQVLGGIRKGEEAKQHQHHGTV